jgi:acyl transferase domain-containing protein
MPPSKMASYVRFGAWVAGVDMFDASAFRLPRAEAATLDPQHRLLLECTAAALQDGGCDTGAQTTGEWLGFVVCGCMNGMCDVHGSR